MRGAFADAAPLVKRPSSVSDSSFRNDSGTTRRRGRPRALNLQTLEVGPLASRDRGGPERVNGRRGDAPEDSSVLTSWQMFVSVHLRSPLCLTH